MNTNDPSSESQVIADNFDLEHYNVVVQKSLVLIEEKLREVIKRDLTQLNNAVQVKVNSHLSAKNKAIDDLGMGEIVGLLRKTKFLDAWKQQFNTDLSVFEMINLDKLVELRNEVSHRTRSKFTQEEAKMVMFAQQVTSKVFEQQVVTIHPKTSLWSPLIKLFKKPVILSSLMAVLLVFGMFGVVDRSLEGNPKEIVELIERAQRGDINAQIALGEAYYEGKKVDKNYQEAKKWFEKAADQGEPKAWTLLGIMYAQGRGVTQNYLTAKELFEKAASQDYVPALLNLLKMYMDGLGVPKDDKRSDELIEKFKQIELQNPGFIKDIPMQRMFAFDAYDGLITYIQQSKSSTALIPDIKPKNESSMVAPLTQPQQPVVPIILSSVNQSSVDAEQVYRFLNNDFFDPMSWQPTKHCNNTPLVREHSEIAFDFDEVSTEEKSNIIIMYGGFYKIIELPNKSIATANISRASDGDVLSIVAAVAKQPGETYLKIQDYCGKQTNLKIVVKPPQAPINCQSIIAIPQEECNTLINLYQYTEGRKWFYNYKWLKTDNPCEWYGINCENGRVSSIAFEKKTLLGSGGLRGEIPDLSPLVELKILKLDRNKLIGNMPSLLKLSKLEEFHLDYNQLSGMIPDLSQLKKLKILRLNNNKLTGIPDLSQLKALEELYLQDNQLIGAIPDLRWLENLKELRLNNNQLTGIIPDLSWSMNLELVDISNNQLSGRVSKLSSNKLKQLVLFNNQLTGKIPNLSGLENLTRLQLDKNQLIGSIPDLTQLKKLEWLDLSSNQLTGGIPDLSKLESLSILRLGNNSLSKAIPDLSSLKSLWIIDLSNNQLVGEIPSLSQLKNLGELRLFNNRLSGSIPDLSNLAMLRTLQLFNNQLTGKIPDLSKLSWLSYLDLSNNRLTGAIPDLSKLEKLEYLDISNNSLCRDPKIKYTEKWQKQVNEYPLCPIE